MDSFVTICKIRQTDRQARQARLHSTYRAVPFITPVVSCTQVCVQPSTAADNVTLLAFAADRRAAAGCRPRSNRSISPAAGPTAANQPLEQTD